MHARFVWSATTFVDVTFQAGTDNILPGVRAATTFRHDVVQAESRRAVVISTILTAVLVSQEDIATIEFHRVLWLAIVGSQANDPRHLDFEADRLNPVFMLLFAVNFQLQLAQFEPSAEVVRVILTIINVDDFRQFLKEQTKSTPRGDDVHRLKVSIEDQNAGLNSMSNTLVRYPFLFRMPSSRGRSRFRHREILQHFGRVSQSVDEST